MATLEWTREDAGPVTLVGLQIETDAAATVRVDPTVDGPIWPPRRQGQPAAGWDDDAFEGTVPAEGRLVLGFATPCDPPDPPVSVTELGPGADAEEPQTPEALVRQLGESGPPREAVPTPTTPSSSTGDEGLAETHADTGPTPDGEGAAADGVGGDRNGLDRRMHAPAIGSPAGETPPEAVTDWLDDVAERVSVAEELAAASSVAEARETVRAVGGMDAVTDLESAIAADRRALEALSGRVDRLEERLATAEVPTDTLARLV